MVSGLVGEAERVAVGTGGIDLHLIDEPAARAHAQAMTPLAGPGNIRDFIACVVQANAG